jgi:alpha-beta hydrolase superfamily lysophospholipase
MKSSSAWRRGIDGTSRFAWRWTRRALWTVFALLAALAIGFASYAVFLLPDLAPWHTDILEHEFDARRDAGLDFAGYQALEGRLFDELKTWQARHATTPGLRNTRFDPGGPQQRLSEGAPYNRSFRLAVTQGPMRGSALLVHGLTDSPYAMRALAETLHAQGIEVTVLRLPGHGTLPSMMTRMRLADWEAAVRLAAQDAAARRPAGTPFYLGGFSTGGALVLSHALEALDDATLPRATRLFLIAPAVRIVPAAALANVLDLAAVLPVASLQKVKWQELAPEYDPYKFNSFPVNATRQVHAATRRLQQQLDDAQERGRLAQLPPLTVWQSLVDSTLGARPLLDLLFDRLQGPEAARHMLVMFDVNTLERFASVAHPALRALREELLARQHAWRLTLVANDDPTTSKVGARAVGGPAAAGVAPAPAQTTLHWPVDVVSLGHVALPFPPDDPVYGILPGSGAHGVPSLGALALRGEAGALLFPLGSLTRLRSNPFWSVIESQVQAQVAQDLQAVR